MYKNEKVLYFELDTFTVVVLNHNLIPYYLKELPFDNTDTNSRFLVIQKLRDWLSNKVLSLSRKNAKLLYAMFNIPQSNDTQTRVDICLKCRGVSIQDSYWIKFKDGEKWEDFNIRQSKLKEIINVSLYGSYPTITVSPICPELTTKGLFPKGWVRENKELYLLKTDQTTDFVNTKMEVLASKILSCFDVNAVEYTGRMRHTEFGDKYVNKCKNFVTEEYSFVEAFEVIEYCNRRRVDFEEFCINKFKYSFTNIPIIDYILMNTDRHTQNYGFLQDDWGNLVAVAPLFDFNNALVSDYFGRTAADTMSQMFNKYETITDCMLRYLPYSKITVYYDRLMNLKKNNKEYRHILDNVIERVNQVR